MAVAPRPDPLTRATEALREEEPPAAWPQVSDSVKGRVRRLTRPHEPVSVLDAAGSALLDAAGSRTYVSTRVLLALLRERLTGPDAVPWDVHVDVEAERCEAVRLELVCSYGTDLQAAGAATRAVVLATLGETLGAGTAATATVEVEVVDVVLGDPRTT